MAKNEIATIISVGGMSCPNCELRIENELKTLSGLISVKANYSEENVSIVYDSSVMKEADIIAVLERIDYNVKSTHEQNMHLHNSKTILRTTLTLLGIVAAIIVILIAVIVKNIVS